MKRIVSLAAALCLAFSLVALAGCQASTDPQDLKGEWKVKDTDVTFVFTGEKLRSLAGDLDYTLDTNSKTISYQQNGQETSSATYSFSDDKQTLTLDEHFADGGERQTVFVKVSDNVDAEPALGADVAAKTSKSDAAAKADDSGKADK